MSQNLGRPSQICCPRRARLASARRGAVALEFAILAIPFFLWLLFILEMSYDLFVQEALDYAVHGAVRQIQTGSLSSDVVSGATFIKDALCGQTRGLLECPHLWVRVAPAAGVDFAPPSTSGALPVSGGTLDLSQYTNEAGANAGPQKTPYCAAAGKQAVLVSVIYLGPSFVSSLLPGALSVRYNGAFVHPTLSTAGFITEAYTGSDGGKGTPQC